MMIATMSTAEERIAAAGLDWIVPSWPAPPHVQSFATTRNGGVSVGRYAALNLGRATGDDPEAIKENRRRLESYLPSAPLWLRQQHGAAVATFDAYRISMARAKAPVADAAVTRERNVVLAVL